MDSSRYLLTHANVIDVEKGEVLSNYSVEVAAGKIAAISPDNSNPQGLKVIDLQGLYLLPGLINLHTHLFGDGVPKSSVASKGKSQSMLLAFAASGLGLLYLRKTAQKCAKTALLSGVTTLRSVGDMRYADVYARDKINAGKAIGPRLLVSGPALTCPGGHGKAYPKAQTLFASS